MKRKTEKKPEPTVMPEGIKDDLDAAKLAELEGRLQAEADRRNAIARCPKDLPFFCEYGLRIRPKMGPISPMILNGAQLKLHAIAEEQRAKTGKVRIFVLKSRQLGILTYIAARLFHRVIFEPALRAYIIGHEKRASSNLFQICKRFYDHLPKEMKPVTSASSQEELLFAALDSGYLVGTASLDGAGRSATSQLIHASEVAHWPDVSAQLASLVQTCPDLPGTEIWYETTANGMNEAYSLWRKIESHESDFWPVFLGWPLAFEYRRDVGDDFGLTADEKAHANLHNLDLGQMAWRRARISELSSENLFKQEYPIVSSEAFISQSHESFINSESVLRARQASVDVGNAPLILGVDPAGGGTGSDRTAIAFRRGRCIEKVAVHRGLDLMQVAGVVARIINEESPARVFIDTTGLGAGVYDRLREQGHEVVAVNFSSRPIAPESWGEDGKPAGGYANRRAEIWGAMKKALESDAPFQLPDQNDLQSDLLSCGYKFDSSGRLQLEGKQDMRRRGIPSPDLADACALTFAGAGDSIYAPAARPRSYSVPYRRRPGSHSWLGT